MELDLLRSYQNNFEGYRQDVVQKRLVSLEKLRLEFVKKFSVDNIKKLTLEEYVIGGGKKILFVIG